MTALPDCTPILVGAGQASERPGTPGYQALSPTDLAAAAARAACDDALGLSALVPHIDALYAVRTMADSQPAPLRPQHAPFGGPDNVPGAVARRLGLQPAALVYSLVCGAEPQRLVAEACERLARGDRQMVLLTGGEAISTTRAARAEGRTPDWRETDERPFEDRRANIGVLRTRHMTDHGLLTPSTIYPLFEQARRARLGMDRAAYARAMGDLLAPFSQVAAANPHAAGGRVRTAEAIATVTPDNRLIADPHPISVVARDQVNQGAALLLTTVGLARRLGIAESKWVYLHGHCALDERMVLDRPDLGASPAMAEAYRQALARAGATIDDIRHIDLYSCFPIAVFNAMEALGLHADDPRRLTLTGGLPFFGGPGNNYAMHALAEVVQRCRAEPGSLGLVGANGGLMSVHAVGVYGTTPKAWAPVDDRPLQRRLDAVPTPPFSRAPDGWATVETYTVLHDRQGPRQLLLVGRLAHSGERFIAVDGDAATLQAFADDDGLGRRVWVRGEQGLNRATLERPAAASKARGEHPHLQVTRRGPVLQVLIDRPEQDHALTPELNDALEAVFDAYEADASLWVAVLGATGTRAFCTGADLQAARQWLPRSGFGGLTARPRRTKPVIAAVNGAALDAGFEMALACDLIVADETARFALSQPRWGAVAECGGVQRIMRRLPAQAAMGLLLTGREIGAAEAQALGLVNEVVPAGAALEGAHRWAERVLDCSPMAVRATRALAQAQSVLADEAEAVLQAYPAIDRHMASEDRLEGLAAREQGRAPRWRNR